MMNEFDREDTVRERRLSAGDVKEWRKQYPTLPWAATANRRLAFRKINRSLNCQPPTVVLLTGYRLYLFKTGEDRDKFVELFHRGYEAKAYAS